MHLFTMALDRNPLTKTSSLLFVVTIMGRNFSNQFYWIFYMQNLSAQHRYLRCLALRAVTFITQFQDFLINVIRFHFGTGVKSKIGQSLAFHFDTKSAAVVWSVNSQHSAPL